jgi:hypothetical protein
MVKAHVLHVPGIGREQNIDRLREAGLDLCVHEDPRRRGVMRNWIGLLRCMVEHASPSQPWQLQLNDDVRVLDGWEDELDQALWYAPRPVVGLIASGPISVPAERAYRAGKAYAVGPYVVIGPAVAYRFDVVADLLPAAAQALAAGYPHDDVVPNWWMSEIWGQHPAVVTRSLFRYVPSPSLLHHPQHRDPHHTIEEDGPPWMSGFLEVGIGARRPTLDLGEQLAALGFTGRAIR